MTTINNNPFAVDETKRMRNPFVGICSMFMAPICQNLDELEADVAILGIPYDLGTAVRAGCRFGPRGLREASALRGAHSDEGWYDPIRNEYYLGKPWRIVDCGDVDVMHTYYEQTFANAEAAVRKILAKGAVPVVLGGDHAVTIPVLRAFDCYEDLCVIQFDAHLDFTFAPFGIREGQGSPMRRASEMAHVGQMMQIGIRGQGSSQRSDFADAKKYGSKIVTVREVRQKGVDAIIEMVPLAKKYYVTVDIDCLDPTLSSGTGSPQPYGLYYEELSWMIEGIAKKGEIVGFDLVEVAPPYDPNQLTALYGAQIIQDAISFLVQEKKSR